MPDVALLRRLAEQRGVPTADVELAMGSPHPRTALLQLLSATNPDQATYEVMRASNPLALAPPDVEIQEHFMHRAGILGGIEILGGSDDSSSSSGGNAFNCAFDSDDSDDGIQVQSSGDLVQPAQTGEEFEEGEAKVRAAMVEIRSLLERVGPDSAREHWAEWYSLGNKLDLDTRVKDGPDNGVTVELRQLREQIDAAIKLRTRKRAVIVLVTCILTLMWGAHWIYSKTPAYLWSRADCQLSIVKDGRVVRKGGEAHVVHCALGEATLPSGEKVQFPLKDAATIANCRAGLPPEPGTNQTTTIECWQREWQSGTFTSEYHSGQQMGVDDQRPRTADGSLPRDGPVCVQQGRPTFALPLLDSFMDIYGFWWTLPSIVACTCLPCFCSGNLERCKSRCKEIKSRHTRTGASGLDSSALLQEEILTTDVPPSTNPAPQSLSARLFWVRSPRSFIRWGGWWVLAVLCIFFVSRSCWMFKGLVQPAQCEPVGFHRHVSQKNVPDSETASQLDKSNVTECRWDFRVTTTVDSYPYPLLVGTWTALARDVEPKVGDLGSDCRPKAAPGNISCFYQSESNDGSHLDSTRCNVVPSAPSFNDECQHSWSDDDKLHNCMHVVRFSEGVPLGGRVGHLCKYGEDLDKVILGLVLPCLVLYRLVLWQPRHKLYAEKITLLMIIGVYPLVVIFNLWPDGYDIEQIIVFLTCCYVGTILVCIICTEGCRYLQGRPFMVSDEQDEVEDRRRQEELDHSMDGMIAAV